MKNQARKHLMKEFSENFSLTSEEFEDAWHKNISGNHVTKNRWLYMKTHEIISDLHYITTFTRQSSKNIAICDKIDTIVSKLQYGQYDVMHIKVVGVLKKYLKGVQRFVCESTMR